MKQMQMILKLNNVPTEEGHYGVEINGYAKKIVFVEDRVHIGNERCLQTITKTQPMTTWTPVSSAMFTRWTDRYTSPTAPPKPLRQGWLISASGLVINVIEDEWGKRRTSRGTIIADVDINWFDEKSEPTKIAPAEETSKPKSAEQQAKDMLERMGSAGNVLELASLIALLWSDQAMCPDCQQKPKSPWLPIDEAPRYRQLILKDREGNVAAGRRSNTWNNWHVHESGSLSWRSVTHYQELPEA